jgi:hypothetical protein
LKLPFIYVISYKGKFFHNSFIIRENSVTIILFFLKIDANLSNYSYICKQFKHYLLKTIEK